MKWVTGVDGCRHGWCLVLRDLDTGELRARVVQTASQLLEQPEQPHAICIDMPIGLPEFTLPGGRACDREARQALGRRASCVFSVVGRGALRVVSQAEASRMSREAAGIGVGAQAWGLCAKLNDVDAMITPDRQRVIFEVHPEISFWALNDGAPMSSQKKTSRGASERIEALVRSGFAREFVERAHQTIRAGRDDFLDACAATWTAARIVIGEARRFPAQRERDARGLDMAIWF